jgi:hypothetical protein
MQTVALVLLAVGTLAGLISAARADSTVFLKNSTGLYIKDAKLVRVAGSIRRRADRLTGLPSGDTKKLVCSGSGSYVIYVALERNGQIQYARGREHYLPDPSTVTITIRAVIWNDGKVSSLTSVPKNEFERL